jgi:hypothetical protein
MMMMMMTTMTTLPWRSLLHAPLFPRARAVHSIAFEVQMPVAAAVVPSVRPNDQIAALPAESQVEGEAEAAAAAAAAAALQKSHSPAASDLVQLQRQRQHQHHLHQKPRDLRSQLQAWLQHRLPSLARAA